MHVVFSSFGGRYSDNPRALHEGLLARGSGERVVWTQDPRHAAGFPEGLETVPYGSAECVAALEAADLVVSNTHVELDWVKKPGATYLQTWHGTPLKHIHRDVLWAPPGRLDALDVDVARWDALLSPSSTATDWLRGAFRFDGELLESGYPRNDVLVRPGAAAVRRRIRAGLGLDDGTPVVLYTPTWREDLRDESGNLQFALHLDLDELTARLPGHVVLLRLHYELSGSLGPLDHPRVHDVSFHPDVSELYLAADVMITDYSSTMFDFAVTGKPILLFTYDLEHYRDELRGFYVDVEADAPGPLLRTTAEVAGALDALDDVRRDHAHAYDSFRSRFCHLEDGQSTRRVLEHFFR